MHRAAFAAHQAVVALHQLAQHLLDRHAARQRMGMAAIGAETKVALDHGLGKAGGNRLLAEREMAGALDQILQEQVVGALLRLAQAHLRTVQRQALFLADIVVQAGAGLACPRSFAVAMGNPRKPLLRGELSAARNA